MQPSARQRSQGVLVPPRQRSAQRSTCCRQPWDHQGDSFFLGGGGAFWRRCRVPAQVINAPARGGALGRVPGTRPNAPNGEP